MDQAQVTILSDCRHINQNVLRLYGLVSGMPEWRSSDGGGARDVNVCADLDWKRAFAAHLWFLASPVASVADAFVAYEVAAGISAPGVCLMIPLSL